MTSSDVSCRIVPRRNKAGHPFCEVLFEFIRDGRQQHALTRYWHSIDDSPHMRAAEVQQFLRRQAKWLPSSVTA